MSFADEWEIFPDCGVPASTPTTKINNADFNREFEEFCKEQRQLKDKCLAKEAETKQEAEEQPTEVVTEEAYQTFVEEAEKPKSKNKKKTEEVVKETSDETLVVED